MYMASVLWSDQNDIVIYRTFQDFKKMHVSMLMHVWFCACPAGPLLSLIDSFVDLFFTETNEESIPTCKQTEKIRQSHPQISRYLCVNVSLSSSELIGFRFSAFCLFVFVDKKVKRGAQKKGPTRSLVRLKFLQKYCDKLLSCDPRVSQSADLIHFFHPKDQDLKPEFAKNRLANLSGDYVV